MTATSAAWPHDGLVGALHVAGPAGEHAEKLMMFGRFVGSWDLEWTGHRPNGTRATMNGRAALRLGARRQSGPGHLDRARPRTAR